MSLRNKEGYFWVDHRQTQSVPDEVVLSAGLPPGAGRGFFEAPTFTCSHCHTVVVINPNRQRQRYFCHGCDHLLCDPCAAIKVKTGACRTMKQIFDELQEQSARQLIIT